VVVSMWLDWRIQQRLRLWNMRREYLQHLSGPLSPEAAASGTTAGNGGGDGSGGSSLPSAPSETGKEL
jgi:hypothetical protein